MDYRRAGVDTALADKFVGRIQRMVGSTHDERVVSGVGGFAALYRMDDERLLAASTDGVGTKLKLAFETGIHHTIGIDLVAMCVNDLLCTGARPLFFLDYFASGKLDLQTGEAVLAGIVEGCKQGRLALIGGETAEMPGMYHDGEYDLAGFAIGEVWQKDCLDGTAVRPGQALIGLASSGLHSNGYSLVRQWLETTPDRARWIRELLTPTRIYVDVLMGLREVLGPSLTGVAHVTGSGLLNIPRMNPALSYHVDHLPTDGELAPGMAHFFKRSGLSSDELARTFNCGVGMVFATDNPSASMEWLLERGEQAWVIGTVGDRKPEALFLNGREL
jgi:phosphoribosylformylglycinamidine cyclo-ligase